MQLKTKIAMNPEVTTFLDTLQHPARPAIEALRACILLADPQLVENVKWNAPNYSLNGQDRITMKIQPPTKEVLIILHRGTDKASPPKSKLIPHESKLLTWRGNDRAILRLKDLTIVEKSLGEVTGIVKAWLKATT